MEKSDLILLAIEDDEILQLFERALAAGSFITAIARDRVGLDKALQESTPALIIIGQHFTNGNELDLASILLERFPTLPILLFFNEASLDVVKKALTIGISDCLFAPLRIDDIKAAVENSIKRATRIGDWTRREVRLTTASLQRRIDHMQKFDTILENIEDGVIILDDNHNLLLINAAARRTFGILQDEEVTGQRVTHVLPHPDIKALLNAEVEDPSGHHEITFDDGRVLSSQFATVPGIGIAITLQDITYLKQIDRLKNEFVNTVSHDLRSPLTAILGYVDLLERVGTVNEQQGEFIHRIKISVESITSLVNDLLELGRIEAGFESQNELVPLDSILRYALETMHSLILEKRLNLQVDIPVEIPPLHGNPIRLRQLLDNLLGNAIKYTPEGGNITVEMELRSNQIITRISDSGPGVPPADQPHIFEKFYRASNVPKGIGGSGLGLAIVKSIVDSHQGRIWIESLLGRGTTFTVVLPLTQKTLP